MTTAVFQVICSHTTDVFLVPPKYHFSCSGCFERNVKTHRVTTQKFPACRKGVIFKQLSLVSFWITNRRVIFGSVLRLVNEWWKSPLFHSSISDISLELFVPLQSIILYVIHSSYNDNRKDWFSYWRSQRLLRYRDNFWTARSKSSVQRCSNASPDTCTGFVIRNVKYTLGCTSESSDSPVRLNASSPLEIWTIWKLVSMWRGLSVPENNSWFRRFLNLETKFYGTDSYLVLCAPRKCLRSPCLVLNNYTTLF